MNPYSNKSYSYNFTTFLLLKLSIPVILEMNKALYKKEKINIETYHFMTKCRYKLLVEGFMLFEE